MMRWFPWRWNRAKQELSEELQSHLQLAIEDRISKGEDPQQARAAALRELGNVPLIEDVTRVHWGGVWLENALQDVRFALRRLRSSPGYTATVLLTLALGIGANLAVFQLLYSVILAQLPIPHPDELVSVHAAPTPFDQSWSTSYVAFQRLRAGSENTLLARSEMEEAIVQLPNQTQSKAMFELASDNYFQVLGVRLAAGRFFVHDDTHDGQSEWPAVVRYDFARDTFGSAQQALGKRIVLNQVPAVIVGVADRKFLGVSRGYSPDVWLPLEAQSTGHLDTAFDSLGPGHNVDLGAPWRNQPTIFWLALMARIPAPSRAATAAHWDVIFRDDRVLMASATTDAAVKAQSLSGHMEFVPAGQGIGHFRRIYSTPLTLLMALSISVFLVGCLNLANLQIARLSAREQELSVRVALGASRRRLLRQVMLEDAVLVLAGGVGAFLIGRLTSKALLHWTSSKDWQLHLDLHTSLPLVLAGAGLMAIALISFSAIPALHFMRSSLARVAGSRAKVSGVSQSRVQRWRSNLTLSTQVSLSLLLATMAGCLASTLVHFESTDIGMDREHVLSVYLDMGRTGYADRQHDFPGLYRQLQERLDATPGVRSAAVEMCPILYCGWNTKIYPFGLSGLSNGQIDGQEDHVGPGFFATMGIPLLRGRDISTADREDTDHVAVISRSYARQLFGDKDPIGHWVGYEPAPRDHKYLIVGEVADAHFDGAKFAAPPMIYMSINQNPAPIHTIQIRASGDPRELAGRVRQVLHEVDASLPIDEILTLQDDFNDGLGDERLLARLAGIYAGLTLLLVAIGFYGVVSFRTSRRRSEFGIRLALGATRKHVQVLILGQTARILFAGILPGLLLSAAAAKLAQHLLYGSTSSNAALALVSTLVLVLAGVGAAFIPARRAAFRDPLETLRHE